MRENNLMLFCGKSIQKDIRLFYRNVIRHPLFYFPFLTLTIMAYLPSLTNTKRQFEDFHMESYLGASGSMKTGRWGMWLLGQMFNVKGNDIANKFMGVLFLILGATIITSVFYCISENNSKNNGVIKYTIMATTITTFPLINEIWSYNVANLIVCINYFLASITVYYMLKTDDSALKKTVIAALPFVWMSSSYESGLLLYVTLVIAICTYMYCKERIEIKEFFAMGVMFAAPLLIGMVLGSVVGHIIARLMNVAYVRNGDTISHWASDSAFRKLIIGNIDHYFLRAFVYVPIMVFVIAVCVWLAMISFFVFKKKWWSVVFAVGLFVSLFILSLYQGSWFPYREAQNITVFTAFMFFIICDFCEKNRRMYQMVSAVLIVICMISSSFLLKVNLLDYQIAHNDESLVRQLGYSLTKDYYGKPVMVIGHYYDAYSIYSSVLQDEVVVHTDTLMGKIYDRCRQRIVGESADRMKFYDTNLYSTLFLANAEMSSLQQYFSYCGYNLTFIPYVEAEYPEVKKMVDEGTLHPLQIVDMGDFVLVEL